MSKKTDFLVGLFVLLGILAAVFMMLQAGNLRTFSIGQTYHVTAKFQNIGALKVRSPIKSNGVVVGRVSSITFDNKEFKAVVGMDIEAGYQFPDDSSASILTSGLLGEQYIGLTPGGDDKNLADNSEIIYTQSAVVLEELISKFLFSKAESEGAGASGSSGADQTHNAPALTPPASAPAPVQ
ncbi:outer membrane lipid asymmetry maintenance protein MlaD [Advenella mimigardefordensis]|uniref:MCE domain-containing protein n=1 Tax=Advenella mimigardefordensis (strain DSM 17166 / LMG 22922 / DPN7) TaxID=1247726 RepID=W0P6T0_ADVMD|nr:outer membrane lipid asymmetry maintenance protein MlaD [Advenella mimigardefordensis]AHG62579.1 MCE domain-containing protein [Advenella mimigardefordensis DPN7]